MGSSHVALRLPDLTVCNALYNARKVLSSFHQLSKFFSNLLFVCRFLSMRSVSERRMKQSVRSIPNCVGAVYRSAAVGCCVGEANVLRLIWAAIEVQLAGVDRACSGTRYADEVPCNYVPVTLLASVSWVLVANESQCAALRHCQNAFSR